MIKNLSDTTRRTVTAVAAALIAVAMLAGCGASNSATTSATGAISVVSREDGSGTRSAFIELFGILEKGADGSKTDRTTVEATVVSKTDVMLQTIAGDPTAIGYVSMGSLNSSVNALDIDGQPATAEAMLSGDYKISRPFIIATKGDPTGLSKDFIDFILSAEGQAVVAKSCGAVNADAPAYAGNKPSGKITVGGSSSVFPTMEKLQEAYLALNPNAVIELQSSDSTAGMTGTADGIFDIGMASRELKESELKSLKPVAIAIDGIAVITNPQNPLTALTSDAVKAIFTGETTEWSAIM